MVPRDRIRSETGLILRTEKSVLFVIPWGTHWIIGTTDTDWELDQAHPAATSADIDYILEHVNTVLAVPLTHDDIEGVYAGLRPLLAGESEADVPAVPRARRGPAGARADRDRRRQVHDLPGDGAPTPSTPPREDIPVDTGWIFSLLALIVGGIGVTNTMAMSVLERVREIGIMRAVGWRTSRIAAMIVSEALAIGLLALAVGLSRSGTPARALHRAAARSRPWSSPTSPPACSPGGSRSRSASA